LSISLGPVHLALDGELRVTATDALGTTLNLRVEATDAAAGGAVDADLRITARPSNGGTRVEIETSARVLGRIGEFGQAIIKRKADQTMAVFAQNVAQALAGIA
jgi:carbon monoxide dehydrogenase subunit G